VSRASTSSLRSVARLRRALADERGGITILNTALIVVALIVVLPTVWNFGAVRVMSRISHTSSDAAAQAAAESVARRLTDLGSDWWGCIPPETPPQIVRRYVSMVVEPIAWSHIGAGAAGQYAASNRGSLTEYDQHLHRMGADGVHARLVDGVIVPPVHVAAGISVPLQGLIARSVSPGEGTPVPSHASAEAYLARVTTWVTPCPGNTEAVARHYRFRWKIRLVPTGW